MTELCPQAIGPGLPPRDDRPILCDLNNRKPCVDDPDLECDYFINYLHEVLHGDKTCEACRTFDNSRIGGQDD